MWVVYLFNHCLLVVVVVVVLFCFESSQSVDNIHHPSTMYQALCGTHAERRHGRCQVDEHSKRVNCCHASHTKAVLSMINKILTREEVLAASLPGKEEVDMEQMIPFPNRIIYKQTNLRQVGCEVEDRCMIEFCSPSSIVIKLSDY